MSARYYKSYIAVFNYITNKSSESEEIELNIYNKMFGYDKIELILENEFKQMYNKHIDNLIIFYYSWNDYNNIEIFNQILHNYDSKSDAGEKFKNTNNIVNYILNLFFENYIIDLDLSLIKENIKPTFVPSSNFDLYTPLLKKISVILTHERFEEKLSGPLAEISINYRCYNDFKNYLIRFNKILPEDLADLDEQILPTDRNMWKKLYDPVTRDLIVNIDETVRNYREYMSNNETLFSWCGCYAPPSELILNRFGDTETDGVIDSNICDQLCTEKKSINRFATINENGGLQIPCNANVCILSDLNGKYTDYEGNVTFYQACPGCQNNTVKKCICVLNITETDFSEKISFDGVTLSNPPTYNQVCPESICYKYNDEKEYEEYKCDDTYKLFTYNIDNYKESGMTLKEYYQRPHELLFLFLALIVFYIIILLFFLLYELGERIVRKFERIPKYIANPT